MATFKELQERVEEAEKTAQEALVRCLAAETEAERFRQKARIAEVEAEAAVRRSEAEISRAREEVSQARKVAQEYGFERNAWWEKVFLTVIGSGKAIEARSLVTYAASVATAATQVRAGRVEALVDDGLILPEERG